MSYAAPMQEPLLEPEVDPPARLWGQASWLLNQATARANRIVGEHFGASGGRLRYAVLAGLEQYGALSQAELSRRLGIDRGDLVSVLNTLEREGMARRQPDPADSRRNEVHLTKAGQASLYEMDDRVSAAQHELLLELSPAEQDQLAHLLRRLLIYPTAHPRPRRQTKTIPTSASG